MNNQEQFDEFLRCCKELKVRNIHLAEVCLIANPDAADFGSIIIEFDDCSYFVTSKYLPHKPDDEDLDEFCVQRIKQLADIKDEIKEDEIYKTLSFTDTPPLFITALVDEDGYFNGMEWKIDNFFLFLLVSAPALVVHASFSEESKYFLYPHQFGDYDLPVTEGCVGLFPEG